MVSDTNHYPENNIKFLADIWGDGFMSPGGAKEACLVAEGLDLRSRTILDIGCGSGAISIILVNILGAGKVIGVDVEDAVCDSARLRVEKSGLANKIKIQKILPGNLPFANTCFDLVYSKDSIIHIPDKEALCAEVFRVLKPGGWLTASDWLISHDEEPSNEMTNYLISEDLDFAMASPNRYTTALTDAGFLDIKLLNRNAWHRGKVRKELEHLKGSERPNLEKNYGKDFVSDQINSWEHLDIVVKSGELCPHHIRAMKPLKVKRAPPK
ncbi:MAG: methyltransferase domain-containing protein [Paracoccaceae bacterium]|nr:methyltransferase domain-containing protein [Paracoccaceae bacterium]